MMLHTDAVLHWWLSTFVALGGVLLAGSWIGRLVVGRIDGPIGWRLGLRQFCWLWLLNLAPVLVQETVFSAAVLGDVLEDPRRQQRVLISVAISSVVLAIGVAIGLWWTRRFLDRYRGHGLELRARVLTVPAINVPDAGDAPGAVAFDVETDDGRLLRVSSHPTRHWPALSLAAGWTSRRVYQAAPAGTEWRGLRPGDSLWILGAADTARGITVHAQTSLLVRGGIEAAYSSAWVLGSIAVGMPFAVNRIAKALSMLIMS